MKHAIQKGVTVNNVVTWCGWPYILMERKSVGNSGLSRRGILLLSVSLMGSL